MVAAHRSVTRGERAVGERELSGARVVTSSIALGVLDQEVAHVEEAAWLEGFDHLSDESLLYLVLDDAGQDGNQQHHIERAEPNRQRWR